MWSYCNQTCCSEKLIRCKLRMGYIERIGDVAMQREALKWRAHICWTRCALNSNDLCLPGHCVIDNWVKHRARSAIVLSAWLFFSGIYGEIFNYSKSGHHSTLHLTHLFHRAAEMLATMKTPPTVSADACCVSEIMVGFGTCP